VIALFPSWSPSGDTIYYDSDERNTANPYLVFKIAADGSGQTLIGNKGNDTFYSREPYCTTDRQILHVRPVNNILQVFTMNSNGDSVRQITSDTFTKVNSFQKEYPRYYNHKIYFEYYGIYSISEDGSGLMLLSTPSTQGYSISKDGIIAYVNFGYNTLSKELGTVWLMDSDGNNKRQLTHHYIP
jgi:Tol biopolymer transport system component